MAILALSAFSPITPADITLKLATIVPEGSDWVIAMRKGAAEISERTQGRVKFKFYTGGVQGTDNQVRRKMRIGQLHGGKLIAGFSGSQPSDRLPLAFFVLGQFLDLVIEGVSDVERAVVVDDAEGVLEPGVGSGVVDVTELEQRGSTR